MDSVLISRYLIYPRVTIKLVLVVADVKKTDSNKRLITVIVGPVGDSGRNSNNVTFSDASNLLVSV